MVILRASSRFSPSCVLPTSSIFRPGKHSVRLRRWLVTFKSGIVTAFCLGRLVMFSHFCDGLCSSFGLNLTGGVTYFYSSGARCSATVPCSRLRFSCFDTVFFSGITFLIGCFIVFHPWRGG